MTGPTDPTEPAKPVRKPRKSRAAVTATGARKTYADAALRQGRGFTPDKIADYLALLANRVQPTAAAKIVGVTMQTVRDYRAKDPAFIEAERQSRADSVAPVVDKLYELAMDGHMTAILFLLQNADPDNFKDMRQLSKTVKHEGTVTHTLEAGPALERIHVLEARLADRAAMRQGELAPPVIEAELVDE
jgi:hypothetical protein